jgi:aerobic carbon-monoxide dehydrogenase medium subunit
MPTLLPRFTIDQPASLGEASEMLLAYGEEGVAYAGGTELLLAMKQAGLRYRHLVDIKTIPGLNAIEERDSTVRIGALATHWVLERSSLLQARLPALVELEAHVANTRVRATGTLGGNLCFAEPHSDPATLLLCMEARLHAVGPQGRRDLSIEDFLAGPYEVALEQGELLEAISVPFLRPGQRAMYRKFQVHERPMLGLALVLDLAEGPGQIREVRVAIGSASPTPRRSRAAESLLAGAASSVERQLDEAADILADEAELLDDLEGSAEYKRHLVHVYLRRAYQALTKGG